MRQYDTITVNHESGDSLPDVLEQEVFLERAVCISDHKWPSSTRPFVSISCTVYNQEKFIEKCLQGFLNQETTFPVEILIHDDASTDGTIEILKQYESEYPSLIRLTCQVENQFSKGKLVNEFNFRKARGSYIALCHGDDYWIDKNKLEKQVAVMRDLGVSICGHPAKKIDIEGNDLNRLTGFQVKVVSKYDSKELIRRSGNMLPFGSIMITQAAKQDMLENMPPVMFHTGIQMLGAFRSGIAVMPDIMSVYRINVPGSTTEIMLGNYDKRLKTTIKRISSIKHLKKMYGKKFSHSFDGLLAKQAFFCLPSGSIDVVAAVFDDILKKEKCSSKIRIYLIVVILSCKLKSFKFIKSFKNL